MNLSTKIASSFTAVKSDVTAFKRSVNEWIIFLDHNGRENKMKTQELERRISALESRMDRERFMLD